MSSSLRVFVGSVALLAAVAAHAGIITFAPLTTSALVGIPGDGTTYAEAGLTFTSSADGRLRNWGTTQSFNADPNGATLFQDISDASITATKTGGGTFFLNSFDLADLFNTGTAGVLPFSYVDVNGNHVSSLALDNLVGLQTYNFGFEVTSFTLSQVSPFFQLDNVRFDINNNVPEPGTLALAVFALASLRLVSRRARS